MKAGLVVFILVGYVQFGRHGQSFKDGYLFWVCCQNLWQAEIGVNFAPKQKDANN
jgi:hypothetical protein